MNEDIVAVVSKSSVEVIINRGEISTFLGIEINLTDNKKAKIVTK